MIREPVSPDDLRLCASISSEALDQVRADSWDEKPPGMTWTRKNTATHTIGALHFYATQLASGSPEYVATFRPNPDAVESKDLLALVKSSAAILARVAEASPPGTRGFYGAGSPDAEGYLAMGSAEIILHTWDIVAGLPNNVAPPDDLCDRIIGRLFPWSSDAISGWDALLFETGRKQIEGLKSPEDSWGWQSAPLEEWDGTPKRWDSWKGR